MGLLLRGDLDMGRYSGIKEGLYVFQVWVHLDKNAELVLSFLSILEDFRELFPETAFKLFSDEIEISSMI